MQSKALQCVGVPVESFGDSPPTTNDIVDTFRVLIRAQDEFSALDMEGIGYMYNGPPEGVELLLGHRSILLGVPDEDGRAISAHIFALALSHFGKGFIQWEPLIRKLLQEGVDIHGRVRPPTLRDSYHGEDNSNRMSSEFFLTPLDELLAHTRTPFDAKEVADAWLRILSTEGYNIVAYLKREFVEHMACQQLIPTVLGGSLLRRSLVFHIESDARVYWDWNIDPASPSSLLHHDLRMLFASEDNHIILQSDPWHSVWPFNYPASAPNRSLWSWTKDNPEWEGAYNLANERADKRSERKHRKAGRAQKPVDWPMVPGAWPL